jgi:ubiquinone/menaquinone biosynthesis C-methylase UbiE
MKYTGERLVSTIKEYWAIEHVHRYALCFSYIKNKTVLDIACGDGYGSNLMASLAEKVFGVDISEEAVKHAQQKYKASNIEFKQGSASKIPLLDNSVDVAVSFETIEHHELHKEMLEELKRVLKPDGILLISCPDKLNYSDIPKYNNPFHVKELYKTEFNELISSYFKYNFQLSQRTVTGSLITLDSSSSNNFYEYRGDYDKVERFSQAKNPMFNLVLASDSPLNNDFAFNSFFESPYEASFYSDIKKHIKRILKRFKS